MHGFHGAHDVLGLSTLADESAGARAQGGHQVLVFFEGGEDQHPGPGQSGVSTDRRGGFDAVEHGHPDVHQHHIRAQPRGEFDGLAAVEGFTDDGDPVLAGEDVGDGLADQRLVVDHEHAGHRGLSFVRGSVAVTR